MNDVNLKDEQDRQLAFERGSGVRPDAATDAQRVFQKQMNQTTQPAPGSANSLRAKAAAALLKPVDIAFLAYFRMAFGLIMLWEAWRYFDNGWIKRYWIDPAFNFTYPGFGWLRPWPGSGMYWHFAVLGILALCIMLGLWYRYAAALFFLGFTYVFLLDKTHYLNHFYLISLVSFLMILLPAGRAPSLDGLDKPALRTNVAPAWTLWLLRFQIGLVYFYGGLAKLNWDWLRGEPMRMWLAARTDFPLIGPYFTQEWMVYAFSYGGLLFDLLIVPFLLWRRTRLPAFVVAVLFHLTNARLFSIGIFPWFMIAATALFFPPDWPKRLFAWQTIEEAVAQATPARPRLSRPALPLIALLGVYVALQLLLPLRHALYPGNVSWTEEGHRFAWHMKLRDKDAQARFFVTTNGGAATWEINPYDYLSDRQVRKMATRPDMILQFSHYLAETLEAQGYAEVAVRAEVMASLNGRPYRPLVDPAVDLTGQTLTLRPADWILPLE